MRILCQCIANLKWEILKCWKSWKWLPVTVDWNVSKLVTHGNIRVYVGTDIRLAEITLGVIQCTQRVFKKTLHTVFSPGNLDSAVLIPSAFIAGQRSLGSHNDKFVSLFRQFSPVFNSIVLSKISLKCDRKNISQLDRKSYLTIYLIIKCPWQK